MDKTDKTRLLLQIIWDYNISVDDIDLVLKGKKILAGHYTREMLFRKIIESYSWFTILQLFTPEEIKELLTNQVISKLRSPSLKKKYEFVYKRLQQDIPTAG
jgi:hypothetical protein